MSSNLKFTNVIHIRDFVDYVVPDRNHPEDDSYVEVHSELNICQEDDFYDSRVALESIHCCIRTYFKGPERELFKTNSFFYADGRFTAAFIEDTLQITVQALEIQRYTSSQIFFWTNLISKVCIVGILEI